METIHPPEGTAPGAMDFRVADYIDILLSESDDVTKLEWLNGLMWERAQPAIFSRH